MNISYARQPPIYRWIFCHNKDEVDIEPKNVENNNSVIGAGPTGLNPRSAYSHLSHVTLAKEYFHILSRGCDSQTNYDSDPRLSCFVHVFSDHLLPQGYENQDDLNLPFKLPSPPIRLEPDGPLSNG